MIRKVWAEDLKGHGFEYDLGQYNLITGKNGSGKSIITDAITLAVTGSVPYVEKKNPEIMAALASSDVLQVGIQVNDIKLAREFKITRKGTVTQVFYVDGLKVSKDDFSRAMAQNGDPLILNVAGFLDMSHNKKIDYLASLFNIEGLEDLDKKIEKSKQSLNSYRDQLGSSEKAAQKIHKAIGEMELPPGTLNEASQEIEKLEAELKLARRHRNKLKEQQIEQEAAKKAKIDAEEKAKKSPTINAIDEIDKSMAESLKAAKDEENRKIWQDGYGLDPVKSIQAIIEAIKGVGCQICSNGAGILTAKQELKKYKVKHEDSNISGS